MTKYNPWKPPFPTGSLYWDEEDREETFRTHDHPMAFYDLSSEEQETLLEWTKQLKKIKSFNNRNTSYGIKHLFEGSGNGFYIYNGAMKGAMLLSGFKVDDIGELNWVFNVSKKSIKEKQKESIEERQKRSRKNGLFQI